MSYPRFQRARAHRFERYTAGTITFNSTSWVNVPGFGSLAVEAQVGDVLEAGLQMAVENEAPALLLDAVTDVSGTPTNSFGTGGTAPTSTTGDGVIGWVVAAGLYGSPAGPAFYTVQPGDLASGVVTVRFRYRTTSAANKTAIASATRGQFIYVKNLGPADPE